VKRNATGTVPDGPTEVSGPRNRPSFVTLLIAPLVFTAVASPSAYIGYLLVLPMIAVMGLSLLSRRVVLRTADVLMLAWTVLTWVSLWGWSQAPWATEIALRTQLAVCAVFILIRVFATRPGVLLSVALGYVAGAAVVSLRVYYVAGLRLHVAFDEGRTVLEGLDQNYMAYSLTLALLVLYILGARVGRVSRLALFAMAVVFVAATLTAGSRAAILSGAALGLWWLGHRFVPRIGLRLVVSSAAAMVVVSLTGWADQYLADSTEASAREAGDLNGRLTLWPYARDVFVDNPIFGIGAGAFRAVNPLGIVAHNAPLEVATGLGIVGLTVFLGAFYYALVVESREWEPCLRTFYVGALVVVLCPILVSGHWYQAPAMWAVVALISRVNLLVPAAVPSGSDAPALSKMRSGDRRAGVSGVGRASTRPFC
jgi:O-antigen ligase